MGAEVFKLVVYYPDGHLEEMEDSFKTVEEAKAYGDRMMAEIKATEQFHADKHGILGGSKRKKAHYEVYEKSSLKVVCKGK